MTCRLVQTVPLSAGVLTLQEAMSHLRVTSTAESALIDGLVQDATDYLHGSKGILGTAFLPSSWRLIMSASPTGNIDLPMTPVVAITDIRYRDTDGAEQVFASANYRLSGSLVELVTGASWPEVDNREQAFWINFTCGYGSVAAVPPKIKRIAKLLIGHWFENRSAVALGTMVDVPLAAQALITAARDARTLI